MQTLPEIRSLSPCTTAVLRWASFVCVCCFSSASCLAQTQATPTADGLLRGAALARSEIKSLRLQLEIESSTAQVTSKGQFTVEMLDGMLRFENAGQLTVFDGSKRLSFTRRANQDLIIRNEADAAKSTAAVIFDPRILGLSDFCPAALKLEQAIWIGNGAKSHVAGAEYQDQVQVWHVVTTKDDTTQEFWIDDVKFRVHRNRDRTPSIEIDVVSTYAADNATVIPSSVSARRTERGSQMQINYLVTGLELTKISPARFSMESFDVPINTPVLDYDLSKRVGYWSGKSVSANRAADTAATVLPQKPASYSWLVGGGLLALLVLLLLLKVGIKSR